MKYLSLNPFRSGQCLSTLNSYEKESKEFKSQSLSIRAMSFDIPEQLRRKAIRVSIPFDQGNVFRLQQYAGGRNYAVFQTHFPIFLEG